MLGVFYGEVSAIWVIVISILVLVGLSYFFLKENMVRMFFGLLLVIASIFYSPIIYLKKKFVSISEFAEKKDKEFVQTKQYLLQKFLVILEGLLIIGAVIYLGYGIVTSWNSFRPPQYLRDQISEYEDRIEKLDSAYNFAVTEVTRLDNEWNTKRNDLVVNYKKERQSKLDNANQENSQIFNSYSSDQQFNIIKNYLDERNYYSEEYQFNEIRGPIKSFIESNVSDPNARLKMNSFFENWIMIKTLNKELSGFSEDAVRKNIQPTYEQLKNNKDYLTSDIESYKSTLKNLEEQASYNFEAFGLGLLITILSFLIFIWFIGLIHELLTLSVDLAANVNKIKSFLCDNETKLDTADEKKEEKNEHGGGDVNI